MTSRVRFILPALFIAFAFMAGVVKVWDGDVWWHLKCGEIIAQTRSLPAADPFSHTFPQRPWVHEEWLGQVVFYTAYRLGGLEGLILFTAALGAGIFLFAWLTARAEGASPVAAAVFLTAAVFASRSRLQARPEIIGLLFATVFLYVLALRMRGRGGALWLLPPLEILWVNAHPGAVIGAVFTAVAAAGLWLDGHFGGREPRQADVKKLLLVSILCVLACLVNPLGLNGVVAPFKFAGTQVFMRHIYEWTPVTWKEFADFRGAGVIQAMKFVLLFGGAAVVARLGRARVGAAALFALTAAMALRSHRFFGLFAVAGAPIAAARASELINSSGRSRAARPAGRLACVGLLLLAGAAVARGGGGFTFGFGEQHSFPSGAVSFLKNSRAVFHGRMYNEYGLGGYLIHRLSPEFRVFIDPRTTFYGEKFYGRVIDFEAFPTPEKWRKLETDFDLDFAVLSSEQRAVSTLLTSEPGWALVFWDENALVYVRRESAPLEFTAKNEYIYTSTFRAMEAVQWALKTGDPRAEAAVREELERPLRRGGLKPNPVALHALGWLEYKLGNTGAAAAALKKLIALDPRLAGPHAILADVYRKRGMNGAAEVEMKKAAALSPGIRKGLRKFDNKHEKP